MNCQCALFVILFRNQCDIYAIFGNIWTKFNFCGGRQKPTQWRPPARVFGKDSWSLRKGRSLMWSRFWDEGVKIMEESYCQFSNSGGSWLSFPEPEDDSESEGITHAMSVLQIPKLARLCGSDRILRLVSYLCYHF